MKKEQQEQQSDLPVSSSSSQNVRNSSTYITAMRKQFSPDDLAVMFTECYRLVYLSNDIRTMLEVAKAIATYTIGMPAPVVQTGHGANALQAALAAWISNAMQQQERERERVTVVEVRNAAAAAADDGDGDA